MIRIMINPIMQKQNLNTAFRAVALLGVLASFLSSTKVNDLGLWFSSFGLVVGICVIGGYLVWRGYLRRGTLPKSGLELPIGVFVAGMIISLALSANPRIGLERVGQFLILVVIFYILLDAFRFEEARASLRWALLCVSGIISLYALLETYAWYFSWWSQVGSWRNFPPFQYRFLSLAMHANLFMIIVNLCAPLAVVSLTQAKSRFARFGSLFWLVTYIVAALFSSSRAGWLGAAAWIITLVVLYLLDEKKRSAILYRIQRYSRKILTLCSLVAGTAILLTIFYIYQVFAEPHPTHGSGFSLNREMIWGSAISVIKSTPWLGTGPDQLAQALLPASKQSPFAFWPVHAHSTPLQVIAEFGLIVFIPFCGLFVMSIYRGARIFHAVPQRERIWVRASIASLASVAVHGVFEDSTFLQFSMFLVVFHAAVILHPLGGQLGFPRVSLAWLAFPSLAAACITGLNIWANFPYNQASTLAARHEWREAALAMDQAVQRDPSQPGYKYQSGLVWASEWRETGDPQALARARNRLEETLAIDSGNSLIWANLAVLNWHSGLREQALSNIEQAIWLSPAESSYWLNYGYFLEQLGLQKEAARQYLRFIQTKPEVITHPFWSSSPIRQTVLQEAREIMPDNLQTPYWEIAKAAVKIGDFSNARLNLAIGRLYHENPSTIKIGLAQLAEREGNVEKARIIKESLVNTIEFNYWVAPKYYFRFNNRNFFHGIVPGYLKIDEDQGKFSVLQELIYIQTKESDCQAVARTWYILQRELGAGILPDDGYPAAPVCP